MLHAARPEICDADTPVLFVHHGVGRNGDAYRDYWLPFVDAARLLVIAPNFSKERFPGGNWYNYGNIKDQAGNPNPRAQWTYGVDERLFDALREAGVTRRENYGMFGHSAGSQFVHRALSLGFRDRVAVAIAANAGSYAMPTLEIAFPFGLGGSEVDADGLRGLLAFPLTVMAGTEDIDNTTENFPREPQAVAQGATRFARAHAYVASAHAQAKAFQAPCFWSIIDVPGVAHDGKRMSAAAAPVASAALHGGTG
jgi:hypothetical protein